MQGQRQNAANAISILKEYAAVRRKVYGWVNKTVAVHCTDILEKQKMEDQKMHLLLKGGKKKKASRS